MESKSQETVLKFCTQPPNHTFHKQHVTSLPTDFTTTSGFRYQDLKMAEAIYIQKLLVQIARKSMVQWTIYPSIQRCGKSDLHQLISCISENFPVVKLKMFLKTFEH